MDQDANGIIGPGEEGLAGATVELLDSASVVLETWITGANGAYAFTGLTAGAYTVQVELPASYFATTPESVTLDIAMAPSKRSISAQS